MAPSAMTPPDLSVHSVLGLTPAHPKLEDVYELDRELGKGGFGVVHLAHNKTTGQQAAVKSISKARMVREDDIKAVQAEAAIMKLLGGHGNIVSLSGVYEDKDTVYLAMELCEGGELFERIVEEQTFTERKAAEMFKKMVESIKHCHEQGVTHRDLKPENFLLTSKEPDAELKLTDFGLSTFYKQGERLTAPVGSPYYLAPEVLRRSYGHEVDMWSLGVILYILLCGVPPFKGDTMRHTLQLVLKGKVDLESEPWPKISAAAKDCVKRLLEPNASKRATAEEILQHDWLVKDGIATDVEMDSVVYKRMKQFAQMNKLKKLALMVVGQNLSPEEVSDLQSKFKSIDADNSGTITVEELRKALANWGHRINEADLEALMTLADVDGDGHIDYDEFVAATMHLSKLEKEELLQRAFKQLDKDGSGTISIDELADALRQFGIYEDAKDLLATADVNGDGLIDYAEFSWLLRNNNEQLTGSGLTQAKSALPHLA